MHTHANIGVYLLKSSAATEELFAFCFLSILFLYSSTASAFLLSASGTNRMLTDTCGEKGNVYETEVRGLEHNVSNEAV